MKPLSYLSGILFLLYACTTTPEPTASPRIHTNTVDTPTQKITAPAPPTEPSPYTTAEQFLKDVRDNVPYTKKEIPASEIDIPYLALFPKEQLENITLYLVKKDRPLKKIQYAHIFLSIACYQSPTAAKEAFLTISEILPKLEHHASGRPGIHMPGVSAYHGGFLIRKGSYVYSLRRLCGYNKLNRNFADYEAFFLAAFEHSKADSKIVRASCGAVQFLVVEEL